MEIVLNGESYAAPQGSTVLGLLESLGIEPGRVAVEWNGAIVKRQVWGETRLAAGDRVEVVHFVGGGCATLKIAASRPRAKIGCLLEGRR